jgi:hypothetical protein
MQRRGAVLDRWLEPALRRSGTAGVGWARLRRYAVWDTSKEGTMARQVILYSQPG